jgi:hypothetical protein
MTTMNTTTSTLSCSLFHRRPKMVQPIAPKMTVRQARALKAAARNGNCPETDIAPKKLGRGAVPHKAVPAIDPQETMRSIIDDQITTITCALENIQGALDEHADKTNGRPLTWVDVSGLQQLVDSLTRAELI